MYPGTAAALVPDRPAIVTAEDGDTRTYAELDERSARLATFLRSRGVIAGDTVLVVLGNDVRWAEVCWASWRSGLYLGAADRHLTADELVPIVTDAAPRAIVTSAELLPGVRAAAERAGARDVLWLVVGGAGDDAGDDIDFDGAVDATERDPHLHETAGGRLLFSSGTTGRPRPFRVPPRDVHPGALPVRSAGLMRSLGFDDTGNVLLVAGPAYHAGPLGFLQSVHQLRGTVVLMRRFDAEGALAAIERYGVTHSQWVPTMFVRLLRLPAEVRRRHDLSSHRVAVHAGAPCPPEVKRAVLDWWGPIVHEYYGSSEGHGRTTIGPHEWLAHPGSVGRPVGSTVHITATDGTPLPPGEVGEVWFTRPDGASGTSGDLGRLDDDGYLYLTGRSSQTIITGGVNVYPREIENVLAAHAAVEDVAVLGVPDPDFGEQVRAVVVAADGAVPGPALAAELIAHCRARLARVKCPRSVEFAADLPRSDAGKVVLPLLRERYGRPEVQQAPGTGT